MIMKCQKLAIFHPKMTLDEAVKKNAFSNQFDWVSQNCVCSWSLQHNSAKFKSIFTPIMTIIVRV